MLTNTGLVDHQLILRRSGAQDRHIASIDSVAPDETGSLTARLGTGTYEFACHLPGHYEAGMHGRIRVGDSSAASGNVCPLHNFTKDLVLGIAVPPGDVAADHAGLFLLAVVVGAVEGEIAQRLELASMRLSQLA